MAKEITVGTHWRYAGSKTEYADEIVEVVLYQDYLDRYVVELSDGTCLIGVSATSLHEINSKVSSSDQN